MLYVNHNDDAYEITNHNYDGRRLREAPWIQRGLGSRGTGHRGPIHKDMEHG